MADMDLGYKEVISNQTVSPRWRDITVNIGAAQGTLQDIKRPEACGGYTYVNSNYDYSSRVTRNRFIYWRISHDVIEIAEESLDVDLTGNHVCLRFQDTPVLDGVTVHEHGNKVVILVATVSSVHRIILSHPKKYSREGATLSTGRRVVPSILAELTGAHVREVVNCHVLNWSGAPGTLPHCSASWLTVDGEAHFALACNAGSIMFVQLPRPDASGSVLIKELRHSSVIQRVWTGIVPSMMRGVQSNDAALSICFHVLENKTLVLFTLCRDSKIRLWSIKDQECIMSCDLLRFVVDNQGGNQGQHSGQRHMLRKAVGTSGHGLLFGAFLHYVDRGQFIIMQFIQNSGQYKLEYVTSCYSTEFDLTDFCLSHYHLWALWTNVESEPILRYSAIDNDESSCSGWSTVNLEAPVGRDFHFPEGLLDPREAYCQYIFYPGRFSLQTITKAINIYRRSSDSSYLNEINAASAATLYDEVTTTVEMEIQSRASEYELSDEQYIELQQDCWSKFYMGCIQYHQIGTKPMGLFADAESGLMCLIKKDAISFLRPRDTVELLTFLSPDEIISIKFSSIPSLANPVLRNDLLALSRCLRLVHSQFTVELSHDFRYDLFHLMTPETIAQNVVDGFLHSSGSALGSEDGQFTFLQEIAQAVQSMTGFLPAIQFLLSAIDLANGAPQELVLDNIPAEANLTTSKLFESKLGASILSESIQQLVHLRFEVCRDLLIFLFLATRSGTRIGICPEIRQTINSNLIPQTSIFTQAYYLLTWFCETLASSVTIDVVEAGTRQLAILNLSESSFHEPSAAQPATHPQRLIELFVQGDGGALSRTLLAQGDIFNEVRCQLWNQAFLPLSTIVAQLIWPITVNFMLPEFLMSQCQYVQLQDYVRLLQPWCEWNSCSRKFLCGYAHLIQGEPDKALSWFMDVTKNGIAQEEFIVVKVLQAGEDLSQLDIAFYLKVIRLFEQYLHADHVITLAKIAIGIAEKDSSYLPTLQTLLFKYLLELGHNNDAYTTMLGISDYSRKRDCLRQFIVVLFDRHEFKALVEFPYPDLHDEVVEIIESRARTIDLNVHNYYEILYSFHVFRGNFRRAGSVMYEYGMRLGNEVSGLKGLQKQAKCYLAAMNCLKIVDPRYAWIVKPLVVDQNKKAELTHPGMSPKRAHDGEEITQAVHQKQVALIELNDMRKEYELVLARLRLIKRDPDPAIATGPAFTAEETSLLLSGVGLFDVALRICNMFTLSLHPIFEALTTRCVRLMRLVKGDPNVADDAWDWLSENEMPELHFTQDSNVTEHAWRLLQQYLKLHEEKGQTTYHRCITFRLLSHECTLPYWLIASYKERDMGDLLRQYLKFEMLESATNLVIEYVDAILGKGREYFGLKTQLTVNSPPVWMPYTSIDNLLKLLNDAADKDLAAAKLHDVLDNKLQAYFHQAEIISRDMLMATPRGLQKLTA